MKIISIDLESYVHIDLDNSDSSEEKKKKDNGHIITSTNAVLKILKESNTKATFFVVAEIYDWYPELIRKIKKEGHEIGLHTYSHKKLTSKEILESELEKSKKFIKEFKPKGFRAPQIYLKKEYLPILKKFGFEYDSSTYGGRKEKYHVIEFPVSTLNPRKTSTYPRPLTLPLLLFNPPIGSGYLLGILGNFLPMLLRKRKRPYVMFVHPWQITPTSFRNLNPMMWPYYINRKKTLKKLLKEFSFTTFQSNL